MAVKTILVTGTTGLKVCRKCRKEKPANEQHFYKHSKRKDGSFMLVNMCVPCYGLDSKERRNVDIEESRRKAREYQKRTRHMQSIYSRRSKLKSKYGLSIEEVENIIKKQNGRCPICNRKARSKNNFTTLSVDHDHNTGKVRGLICNRCNVCMGLVKDDPVLLRKAADYLERHQ